MAGNKDSVLSVRNLTKTYRTAGEQIAVVARLVDMDLACDLRALGVEVDVLRAAPPP